MIKPWEVGRYVQKLCSPAIYPAAEWGVGLQPSDRGREDREAAGKLVSIQPWSICRTIQLPKYDPNPEMPVLSSYR
jgi:hypothetical protein